MGRTSSLFLIVFALYFIGQSESQGLFQPNNNWFQIRPRDSTGHRTGLGTIGRSMLPDLKIRNGNGDLSWRTFGNSLKTVYTNPRDTARGIGAFSNNYNQMRAANVKGGNLRAHESANYEATKIMGTPNLAAGISATREQYKNFRFTPNFSNSPARKGYGDMRTPLEVRRTMDANQRGRDRAMAEIRG